MSKPSDSGVHFEAVKISMRQSKDGHALVLAIHPDDVPEALFRTLVGQRYMVAMVALDEHDRPIEPVQLEHKPVQSAEQEIVQYAGMLCRDELFQTWVRKKGWAEAISEADASDTIRTLCGIKSRRELGVDPEAKEVFNRLVERYFKETGHAR